MGAFLFLFEKRKEINIENIKKDYEMDIKIPKIQIEQPKNDASSREDEKFKQAVPAIQSIARLTGVNPTALVSAFKKISLNQTIASGAETVALTGMIASLFVKTAAGKHGFRKYIVEISKIIDSSKYESIDYKKISEAKKKYENSPKGAIQALKDMSNYDTYGAVAVPDTEDLHREGAWKVTHKDGISVVYIGDHPLSNDFETIEFFNESIVLWMKDPYQSKKIFENARVVSKLKNSQGETILECLTGNGISYAKLKNDKWTEFSKKVKKNS